MAMICDSSLRTLCRIRTPFIVNTRTILASAPYSMGTRIMKKIDPETGKPVSKFAIRKKRKRAQQALERKNLKRPGPGERKALRKRIVLSNTNAFEVPGLVELTASTDLADPAVTGNMIALPGKVIDQLRVVDAFRPSQGWRMFRQPAMLVRKEMEEVVRIMDDAVSRKGIERKVLVGEKSSGKSVLLLQAMAMAFLKKWVVINLPNCQDLMLGRSEYVPIAGTSPLQYAQPAFTAQLLYQIATANEAVLSKISITPDIQYPVSIPISVQSNLSLHLFAKLGAEDRALAWPIFCALWTELMQPGRPPLLVTVDEMNHVMRDSRYVAADMKAIHSHDLALVAHFLPYMTGRTAHNMEDVPESIRQLIPGNLLNPPLPPPPPIPAASSSSSSPDSPAAESSSLPAKQAQPPTLPNGGLVLSATTNSNKPPTPSLDLALAIAASESPSSPSSVTRNYINSTGALTVNNGANNSATNDSNQQPSHQINSSSSSTSLTNTTTTTNTTSIHPLPNPYIKHDFRVLPAFSTVPVLRINGLSHTESRTVLEYYARSGMLRKRVDERFVAEAWTMAGGGVVGELERMSASLRI